MNIDECASNPCNNGGKKLFVCVKYNKLIKVAHCIEIENFTHKTENKNHNYNGRKKRYNSTAV